VKGIFDELVPHVSVDTDWWNVGFVVAVVLGLAVATLLILASCAVVTVNTGSGETSAPTVVRVHKTECSKPSPSCDTSADERY
jgi:hypothetical protein